MQRISAILALAAVASLAHFSHAVARPQGFSEQYLADPLVLPSGTTVRASSVGQQTTIADWYWLKLVQYVGTPDAIRQGLPQLLPLAEVITDLDPEYGYAYQVAGIVLSANQRFDESNAILDKGMANVPDRWQLPFYAGYNRWYETGELSSGAEFVLRAAKIPGSPAYLSSLATKLYSSAGQIETGLAMVESILAQNPPEQVREDMQARRTELLVERDLQFLEKAIALYEERYGILPLSLKFLEGSVIHQLPVAPDGSAYQYDASTVTVSSPLLQSRLKYHNPDAPPTAEAVER